MSVMRSGLEIHGWMARMAQAARRLDASARLWLRWVDSRTRAYLESRVSPGTWRPIFQALALVVAATSLGEAVRVFFSPTNVAMIYLLAVVVAAVSFGRGAAVLVSLAGVVCFDFFFVQPTFSFAVRNTESIFTFIALALVGLVISYMVSRITEQAATARYREVETGTLYALGRDLTAVDGLQPLTEMVVRHAERSLGKRVGILLADQGRVSALKLAAGSPGLVLEPADEAAAASAFHSGTPAGRGTPAWPLAQGYYLPLHTSNGVIGVLRLDLEAPDQHPGVLRRSYVEAFASVAALAIERSQLADTARQARLLQETDRLQTALLNSISHDLRTPLVSITGALSSLQDEHIPLDETAQRTLVEGALAEADRLNRLVGNLLDMSRIEAGAMRVRKQLVSIQEVVGAALEQMDNQLSDASLTVNIPADLPLVPMDPVLIGQVLVNIFDNAVKYSPPGAPIDVRALRTGACLELSIADRGIGIPSRELPKVFDKFYRVQHPGKIAGTGLGLSICKGIVESHGGRIKAANRPGGGTVITMELPLQPEQCAPDKLQP